MADEPRPAIRLIFCDKPVPIPTNWPVFSVYAAIIEGRDARDQGTPMLPNPYGEGKTLVDLKLAAAYEKGWKSRG